MLHASGINKERKKRNVFVVTPGNTSGRTAKDDEREKAFKRCAIKLSRLRVLLGPGFLNEEAKYNIHKIF